MLGDHLGASRDLTLDTVSRIEVAMQRLETNMNQEFRKIWKGEGKDGNAFGRLLSLSRRCQNPPDFVGIRD